jgi:hypothetical protein
MADEGGRAWARATTTSLMDRPRHLSNTNQHGVPPPTAAEARPYEEDPLGLGSCGRIRRAPLVAREASFSAPTQPQPDYRHEQQLVQRHEAFKSVGWLDEPSLERTTCERKGEDANRKLRINDWKLASGIVSFVCDREARSNAHP